MKTKRTIAWLIIAIIAIGGIFALSPSEDQTTDIRYGGQYYPGEFFLLGMPDLWDKYDLNVEHIIFSSGAENNEALIAGKLDINIGADSKTIALFNAIPDDALIIGTVQRGNRYTTIVRADSEYQSWDDLKGKTVATRFGTGAEGVLRRYYAQEGYNWEDFKYVNLKIEDMIAALDTGQIEAFTAWEPTPAIAEAKGIGEVMRTYGDIALVPASIHTTKDFAYNNEDLIVRFLAAQIEKSEFINDHPKEAAIIASEAAEKKAIFVSPEAFEKVYGRIDFSIDFDEDVIASINDTAEFLYDKGKIQKIPELEWDRSFIEKAKKIRGK